MAPILGVIFAVMVGLLAIRPYISYQQQSFESVSNANTAAQFRQVLNATQAYIQDNYALVQSNAGKTGYSPAISVLQNYLPGYNGSSLAPTNPYGQSWNIYVSPPSQGGMQAFVYSAGGQAIAKLQTPVIAAETGAQGGFVPYVGQYGTTATSNIARGAYGFWSQTLPANINPGPGHLVGLLTFSDTGNGATTQSDYLYRVNVPGDPGLNTMQTSLDMGGGTDSITDAASVQVSPNASTPFLAELSDTTTNLDSKKNPLPGGSVQTNSPNGGANSTVMQSDNTGASAAVSANAGGTNVNNVTIAANNTQASLTVGNNAGTPNLTFISTPQQQGGTCNVNQRGTIALSNDNSGAPLFCSGQNSNYIWRGIGGDFTQTQETGTVYAGTSYAQSNNSGKPEFISTYCLPQFGNQWLGGWSNAKFYVTIKVYNSSGTLLSTSGGREYIQTPVGTSGSNATIAPSTSAIVPSGDNFIVFVDTDASQASTVGGCQLMITN